MRPNKKIFMSVCIVIGIFFIVEAAGFYMARSVHSRDREVVTPDRDALMAKNRELWQKISSLSPKRVHIVVDTAKNILYLRNGNRIIREMVVSCGSGNILEDPAGDRVWVFDTPRGEHTIKSKLVHPNWVRPDWAFIEEGEPIPQNATDRMQEGVLGDYALGLGNGYFIHGTLYTRLLGRNVTHGCIRVGDEDLKKIFKTTPIGAKVTVF